jgi:di/tricarboxylate transporter
LPAIPTEILLTLGVTLGALALFVWNRLRVDVVGLIVLSAVVVLGLVTPQEGISGFANEATVTVAAMLVLSAGLMRTGAVDLLGRWMARVTGRSETRLLLVMLATIIPVSALINNTAAVAVLLPVILGRSREIGVAPSRLLMPLSFGSQLGGTLTLIGTSTNLLVAGLVLDLGLARIGLFDITPPALVLTALGVIYMLTLGRWLTPTREAAADLLSRYELREYLTGLVVGADSPLAGRSLAETHFGESHGLQVLEVRRGDERIRYPDGSTVIQAADRMVVRGKIADIAQIEEVDHLKIAGTRPELESDPQFAELIVPPRSPLAGRSIRELNFRVRYGITAVGIQRHGEAIVERMSDVRLEPGDVLLVQGDPARFQELHRSRDLAVLGAVHLPARRRRKIPLAVLIMALVVLLPALEVTTILVSSILGVVAMFVTGCITPDEAYGSVDWMVIVLLGSILPLGIAMQRTGAAELLAAGLLQVASPLGLYGVLATVYLLTSVMTEVITNNAAAVVITPLAVAIAAGLGVSPLPFVVAVMFAASNSFVTPIGYQTNTFIFGPGGYRFSDFVRVGGPLNLIMVVAATFVIPFFFPFHAP